VKELGIVSLVHLLVGEIVILIVTISSGVRQTDYLTSSIGFLALFFNALSIISTISLRLLILRNFNAVVPALGSLELQSVPLATTTIVPTKTEDIEDDDKDDKDDDDDEKADKKNKQKNKDDNEETDNKNNKKENKNNDEDSDDSDREISQSSSGNGNNNNANESDGENEDSVINDTGTATSNDIAESDIISGGRDRCIDGMKRLC